MPEEKQAEGQPAAAPPSGGGFWKGLFVGGLVIGIAVWAVTAFAYYHPRLAEEKTRADNAEDHANMQARLLANTRRQLGDAREAANRAQEAGQIFAEVIQQLDKAFQELGLQTEEAASEEGTKAPAEQGPEASAEKGREDLPSEGEAKTPPKAQAED
jgi:hypothetical protein